MKKNFKKAFTLAEVLATLTVLGVVAALCIPTVLVSYKDRAFETKLQKFYSNMNSAINLSAAENGPTKTWITPIKAAGDKEDSVTVTHLQNYYDKYFKKYLNSDTVTTYANNSKVLFVEFLDGSGAYVDSSGKWTFTIAPADKKTCLAVAKGKSCSYTPRYPDTSFDFDPRCTGTDARCQRLKNKGIEPLEATDQTKAKDCAYLARQMQLNDWKIPNDMRPKCGI